MGRNQVTVSNPFFCNRCSSKKNQIYRSVDFAYLKKLRQNSNSTLCQQVKLNTIIEIIIEK
jgi:hypothetical protein